VFARCDVVISVVVCCGGIPPGNPIHSESMASGGNKVFLTDPINTLDVSSLSALDQTEIAKLRSAYDRARPKAVAQGMARPASTRPDLFGWLVKQLTES
jgi:hypothetical protein